MPRPIYELFLISFSGGLALNIVALTGEARQLENWVSTLFIIGAIVYVAWEGPRREP